MLFKFIGIPTKILFDNLKHMKNNENIIFLKKSARKYQKFKKNNTLKHTFAIRYEQNVRNLSRHEILAI